MTHPGFHTDTCRRGMCSELHQIPLTPSPSCSTWILSIKPIRFCWSLTSTSERASPPSLHPSLCLFFKRLFMQKIFPAQVYFTHRITAYLRCYFGSSGQANHHQLNKRIANSVETHKPRLFVDIYAQRRGGIGSFCGGKHHYQPGAEVMRTHFPPVYRCAERRGITIHTPRQRLKVRGISLCW